MSIYLVKEEDTIDKIAGLYDVSVEEIAYINQIPYPYRLAVGEADGCYGSGRCRY